MCPGRTRDFAYSEPYFNAGEILVKPRWFACRGDGRAWMDKRLAVELGAQGHVEATQWAKRLPDLAFCPIPAPMTRWDAVAAGEADAALVDGVSGRLYLKEQDRFASTTGSASR